MKNNIFKKLVLCSLLVVFLNGCSKDFLNVKPTATLTVDQFYKTPDDFKTAIVGVYNGWQLMISRNLMQSELRSDNVGSIIGSAVYGEFTTNIFSPNSTDILWSPFYTDVISPANIILDKIDGIDMDEATKNTIKGEALFFRGFSYFWMNLMFEGVPLVTKPLTIDESYKLARSSEEETWAQAESDFAAAVQLLPAKVLNYGRVNKYVAETFLAKTYMQQKKWGPATPLLADVFTNSGYSLQPNWADLWTLSGQASSPEIMLAALWNDNYPDQDMGQWVPISSGGFRFLFTRKGFLESFENGDIRRDQTVVDSIGVTWNHKYDFGYKVGVPGFVSDVVVLRFTDVQLLYAEALTMSAGSIQQQSLDLINQTRNRAGLGNILMSNLSTMDDFVDVVLAERRAEFVFECQRYEDLKRYGKLVEKVNATGYNFDDNYNRIPIPQSEIDKSSGVLVQNPGY